jgi:hypothetical protein
MQDLGSMIDEAGLKNTVVTRTFVRTLYYVCYVVAFPMAVYNRYFKK